MGFVHTVENYKHAIINGQFDDGSALDLKNIMVKAYPKSHVTLLSYIDERVKTFKKAGTASEQVDYAEAKIEGTINKKDFLTENFNKPKEKNECV